MNRESRITRRGFVHLMSGALLAAAALRPPEGDSAPSSEIKSDSAPLAGKIAPEEHFDFAETQSFSYASLGSHA